MPKGDQLKFQAARLRKRNESSEMKAEMIVIMPTTVRRWRENL